MFRVGERGEKGRELGFRLREEDGEGEGEGQQRGREEKDVRRPEVTLGDLVGSDAVDGNRNGEGQGDGDGDEDESSRPQEDEEQGGEEDTPRAKRAGERGHLGEAEAEAPAESTHWSEVPSLQLDRSRQRESIEHADNIRRHTEAYNAMIANAVPLIPPPSEQTSMETPSRKRTRPFEIAASDDSSSFDPISPQRYANSTPRRSAKRMRSGTPLSGSRRTSAPGRLFASPRKCGSLSGFENLKLSQSNGESSGAFRLDGTEGVRFKEEKRRDNSDPGVHEIVRDLRDKYPDSGFETDNGRIRCLDCEKSYQATFYGLENHVRSKAHQNNIKDKIANPVSKQIAFKDTTLFPPKVMDLGIDFTISQQPLAVYAQRAAQNLASTREQYLKALENENHTGSIRMSFLESRQEKAEKQNAASLEKFKASEERTRGQILEVKDRLDTTERSNDDRLKSMEALVKKNSDDCDVKLDKMFTSLAKSDHRNIENIDDLKTNLRRLDEGVEEQMSQLKTKIMELEELNTGSQREDIETSIRKLENSDLESRTLRAKMETRLNDVEKTIRESEKHRFTLEAQIIDLQTSHEESKTTNSRLQSRIEELERANARKEEDVHDLEASLQMLTEDLQRQRDSNLSYQKTIKDQIEAHFQFTEKTTQNTEKATAKREEETKERERALEERLMGMEKRIERMEKKNEDERESSNKKIQRLKEKNKELQGELDELQARVVPLIFEDAQEVREKLVGVEEKVGVLEGLAVKMQMGGTLEVRSGGGCEGSERREVTV
ncbi:hypothetical protein DL98DRAFT_654273 [Cadophora sp. DSE1049]|nr:hypothetical protein DL98DRAFT_654273 [Cadophora sp. DSE1049]